MDNCDIGHQARRSCPGWRGAPGDADRARGWHVTDSGIAVIGGERSTVPVAALVV